MTTLTRFLVIVAICGLFLVRASCAKKEDPGTAPPDTPPVEAPDKAPEPSEETGETPEPAAPAIAEIKTAEIQFCNS